MTELCGLFLGNKLVLKTNPCKFVFDSGEVCASPYHTAMYHKRSALRTTKPMNPIGKVAEKTAKAVKQWEKTQKANHQGYHVCFYCGKWITYLRGEHTFSKAHNPEFRTDISKLVKTCDEDNKLKGSMNAEDFIRKYYPNKLYLIELLPK